MLANNQWVISKLAKTPKLFPHLMPIKIKVESKSPNAYKFELFYFDCFPLASGISLLEVDRNEEFAPVKNANGADSPESARLLMSKLHQKWLRAVGF
jgi:UDP-N-acetylglucosamine/UDP-N-acetylgalactosamine diphosphorylase